MVAKTTFWLARSSYIAGMAVEKKPENLALGAREYQSPTLPEKAVVSSTEMLIN